MIYCALQIVFAILLFNYHNYFFIILFLFSLFLNFKCNTRKVFLASQGLIFAFSIFNFNSFRVSEIVIDSNEFMVIEKHDKYVILENGKNHFLFYNEEINKGNKVKIEYTITPLDKNNSFNNYLMSQKINYLIEGEIISNDNQIFLNERIINYFMRGKDDDNEKILRLILFNQKSEQNSAFYELFDDFSLNFLIVISGYHINLLFRIFRRSKVIKYIFGLFYLFLLDFPISSFKAFIYFILKRLSHKCDWCFNNIDLISFIMIAFLFYNPSYLFNRGFIYSFLFSFSLEVINAVFYKRNMINKAVKKICLFLISCPLVMLDKYEINILSLPLHLIISPFISFLFIFSFLYLFLDKFFLVYKGYVYLITNLLNFLNEHSLTLIFGKPNLLIIIFFYLFLFLVIYFAHYRQYIRSVMSLLAFITVAFLQYNLPNLDRRETVYFLDVGEGDCSILKIKNSKTVAMIDTGGLRYRDLAKEKIIPFLKSKGIKEITVLIISHDDFDHNGAKEGLVNNFSVKSVIEDSLVSEVNIGNKRFINLNVNERRDNDGSIVLYGEYGGNRYLFSGDISSDVEQKIIENNKVLDVDVLKVAHHGSKTSTSEDFLDLIGTKVAVISVGKNNHYNHPNAEILEKLERHRIMILRTDQNGTITIDNYLKKKRIFKEKDN